ncbi:uncharacterized protein TrAFT101_010545 [Trichoderma asperellum]|uniref:uncharacterized protein n=1 Tax=Trichoderma asperellum TaxID=101201 RepID=UPI0033266F07|nr:hypothetical protein TrAFT101_010545 [Trichoderma asperellum]
MSNNTFTFKLDPSSLPQLTSRGDNYAKWKAAWTIAFRFAELWGIVENTNPRPIMSTPAVTEQTALLTQWSKEDNRLW